MKVRITLTSDLLGTQPGDDELFDTIVKAKNPDPDNTEELGTDEIIERGTTIFRRDPSGTLCICDYHVKGFLKQIGEIVRKRRETEKPRDDAGNVIKGKNGKAFKSSWEGIRGKMDENVHVFPELISLGKTEPDSILQRPLLTKDFRTGVVRTAIARSEVVTRGTSFECEIITRGVVTEAQLRECLNELPFYGLGQWRNAGHGRAKWEEMQ